MHNWILRQAAASFTIMKLAAAKDNIVICALDKCRLLCFGNSLKALFFVVLFLLQTTTFAFNNSILWASENESFLRSKQLIWEEKIEEAEALLETLLEDNPNSSALNYELGSLFFRQNKIDEALPLLKAAAEIEPHNPQYKEMLGAVYFRKGQWEKSLDIYKSLINSNQGTSTVYFQTAQIYNRLGDTGKALDYAETAHSKNPFDKRIMLFLAEGYRYLGDYKKSALYYETVLKESFSGKKEIMYQLADVYEESGQFDDAVRVLTQIAETYAGEREAYSRLATIHRMRGNMGASLKAWVSHQFAGMTFSEAVFFLLSLALFALLFMHIFKLVNAMILFPIILVLGAFKKISFLEYLGKIIPRYTWDSLSFLCFYYITHIKPDYAPAWYHLGAYYERNHCIYRARTCFEKAVKYDPQYEEALHSLGVVYVRTKRYKQAEVYLKKALEKDEENFLTWYSLGVSYYEQGSFEEAMTSAKQAVLLERNFTPAVDLLIESCESLGDLDFGRNSLESLLQKDPRNVKYLIEMGNLLLTSGRAKESLDFFERSIESRPNSYEAWYNYGVAQREAGLIDNAAASIEKAMTLSPDSSWLYASFGLTCIIKNQHSQAEKILRKALELDPLSAYSHFLLGIILKSTDPDKSKRHIEMSIDFFEKEIEKLKKPWHIANEFQCIGIASIISGRKDKAKEAFNSAIKYAQVTPENIWIFSEKKMKLTTKEEFLQECIKKLDEFKAEEN